MINLAIIILVFVGRSRSELCVKSTDKSNGQLKTEKSFFTSTSFHPVITTTIKFGTCINKAGSNEAGSESRYLSQSFKIDFSQIKSLFVYSGENIDALKVNYLDDESSIFGNIKNTDIAKVTKIEFFNKKVIAVNIGWQLDQEYGFYSWVKSIQFLFFDLITKKYETTPKIGGELVFEKNQIGNEVGGFMYSTSFEVSQPLASEFQITSIGGLIDNYHLVMLKINYSYSICNPISPMNLPSSFELFLPQITSTTISFGSCETKSDVTKIFGTENYASYSSSFSVNFSDLKSFEIYSGISINAIKFNFLNGMTKIYGDSSNESFTLSNTIDIINKKIIGINIRSSSLISSLQFLIYDSISKESSWTSVFGGSDGELSSLNGSSLEVTALSGTADYDYLRTFSIGYNYKLCNPIN
jgi:hypothetical protein